MKFLLVDVNAAVRKIFNITAHRLAIHLDVVDSISQIPLEENYDCIFIDDGVLSSGDFISFKNKMIRTKFYLILSKDKPLVNGFDGYINKPFLPTDIYEAFKKEQHNEMDSYGNTELVNNANNGTNQYNNQNANNINLSEFNDSKDEFLSGVKDSSPLPSDTSIASGNSKNTGYSFDVGSFNFGDFSAESAEEDDNAEVDFTYDNTQDVNLDTNNAVNSNDESVDLPDDNIQDDIPITSQNEIGIADNALDTTNDNLSNIAETKITQMATSAKQDDSSDDIDFNSIFAIQDEFLESQTQNKKKHKFVIGGDGGYVKKDIQNEIQDSAESINTQNTQNQPVENLTQISNEVQAPALKENLAQTTQVNISQVDQSQSVPTNIQNEVQDSALNNDTDQFDDTQGFDMDFDDILSSSDTMLGGKLQSLNKDELESDKQQNIDLPFDDFESNENIDEQEGNIFGFPIYDEIQDDDFKRINAFSDKELEELDDEALLKLQEDSLNDLEDIFNEYDKMDNINSLQQSESNPKVLDKNDISELTDILESANLASPATKSKPIIESDPLQNDITIQNDEFGSLTQEALSEALDETNADKSSHFSSNDSFDVDNINLSDDLFSINQSQNNPMQDFLQPQINQSQNTTTFIQPTIDQSQGLSNDSVNLQSNQAMQNLPPNTSINVGKMQSNVNVDLADIIKSFPVDTLRELLSGAQITINITFPTKHNDKR